MERVAKFEKVSFDEFRKEVLKLCNVPNDHIDETEDAIKEFYDNIKLPERKTTGSAGYDFHAPFDIIITSRDNESTLIPTGVRVKIKEGWVLQAYPRSGLGFKHRIQLDNTVGIIDSDYYNSDNEGHIFAKLTNDSRGIDSVYIKAGEGFMQGVFVPFGITEDDHADGIRNGGFGSTTNI